ncbi:MAG: VWA domain-containing protein [Bacteroidota bacterium]|nr:VWA domain-containing protein [Bacteroidota bacterium]MDP4253129.1 VWA domain-containing protein [Bacteroidota bacterium]MDP4259025.1 VWA domain-containing protein [Bacteroidota bacterium]
MLYDWLQYAHFGYPGFFWLFALLPLMIWWEWKKSSRAQGTLLMSTVSPFVASRAGGLRSWKIMLRHAPFVLRLMAISAVIVGLARPQTRNDEQLVNGEGIDIVLCLDISGSMLAQDFTPNRMEAAKNVASEFIDNRPTDRIGIVIFSGESFTMCPLTTDRTVLKTQLTNVQSGLLEDGTAIGSGLATGVDRLRSSPSKSKVIILLTDGENNGGLIDPNTALEIAKEEKVKVYTIGMGTEGYAPVPYQTAGGVVMTREKVNIDEKLLTQIAKGTGGRYYRAKDNESLKNIYHEIDQLEKSKIETQAIRRYTEHFFPLAAAAAMLLLLEVLLRTTLFRKFP